MSHLPHSGSQTPLCRIAVFTLMCGFGLAAYAQETLLGADLAGLLTAAKSRNPDTASMRWEAMAAEQRIVPAGALPDPKWRMELRDITRMGEQSPTLAPSQVGSTRYLLMQDLPWSGKRDLRREGATAQADAARERALAAAHDLAAKVKATYAQLYYRDQSERLTRELLDTLKRLEAVAQARYASGLVPQQDVLRAQLEQASLRGELIALEAQYQQLRARMNALLGRAAAEPLAAPAGLPPQPAPGQLGLADLVQRLQERNPLLRAEAAQSRAAQTSRDLAYKNRYPDFTVGVSPIQYGSAIREWELMVELNIPLQQGARRAQEQEAQAMLSAAESRREALANQLQADLADNLAALQAAQRMLALTTHTLLPQSTLTWRSALAGYEAGKVDFATVLDAQKQIRQTQLEQTKAGVETQMRLAELERIVGDEQ